MNLYIRIQNGVTFEHPILEENARQAWPDLNFDLLPDWLARFRRYAQPGPDVMPVGVFQRAVCSYTQAEDGAWQDTWMVEDMTAEEQQVLTRQRLAQAKESQTVLVESARAAAAVDGIPAETVSAWNTYADAVAALQITDPFTIDWPAPPRIASDGYPIV